MLRLVLLCVLIAFAAGLDFTSNGKKGNVCSNDGSRLCPPEEASCEDGSCKCKAGTVGIGGLMCAPPSDNQCSTTNDPLLKTFSGGTADLPVPCQYLLTNVTRKLISSSGQFKGTCHYEVFSFNLRVRGKFYPGGFDVHVRFYDKDDNFLQYRAFSVEGTGNNGAYKYETWGAKESDRWLSDYDKNELKVFNRPFTFDLDKDTNRFKLDLTSACGLKVQYRAPDVAVDTQHQTGIPGVSINIGSEDVSFPKLEDDKSVCLNPDTNIDQVVDSYETRTAAFIERALTSSKYQTFVPISQKCRTIDDALHTCDTKQEDEAANICSELLMKPLMVNCYTQKYPDSRNADSILGLVEDCVKAICSSDNASCNRMVTNIENLPSDCKGRFSQVFKDLQCPVPI